MFSGYYVNIEIYMESHFLAVGLLCCGVLPAGSQTVVGPMPLAPASGLFIPTPAAPLNIPSFQAPSMGLEGVLGSFRLPAPQAALVPGRAVPMALPVTAKPKATDETVRKGFQQIEEAGRQASKHYTGFDARQRESLFRAVADHKVAGLDQLDKYDPTGIIGFCFGRAMAAHLIALRMGLTQDNIRKLFIVGDLRSGDKPEWRFHVTTLVRGIDGAWYAVDPVLPEAMEMSAWIAKVQDTWDKGRKSRLYVTPADTVLPKLSVFPETPEAETGELIIELKFDPKGKKGFEAVESLPDKKTMAFDVDAERAARYFDGASGGQGTFGFMGIRINGEWFDFNSYFADLIEAVLSAPDGDFEPAASLRTLGAGGAFSAPLPRPRPGDLGSFRVKALQK